MDDHLALLSMAGAARGMISRPASFAVLSALACVGCVNGTSLAVGAAERPASWAQPLALPGVPNLYRVSPLIYRSGQPTPEGFENLEKLGVRTVINLRTFNQDEDESRSTALRLERTQVLTWHVTDREVLEVMRALRHTENAPFLIHCHHGADRTGLMIAMHRVLEEHWTVEQAIAELQGGGFGFHTIWRNIPRYLRHADVAAMRAALATKRTG
jgi:protein tyrosine phosphatase (PTP) superfamily phosphohydrolase (DUF442 family)